jgi:hypothetical protein
MVEMRVWSVVSECCVGVRVSVSVLKDIISPSLVRWGEGRECTQTY